ncbi:MAG: DNA-methyltransferase, partial [Candidatus Dormibacterales bacterium]
MSARLPAYLDGAVTAYLGDVRQVLAQLPEASVDCCVTSPPYWGLRDYGIPAQVWGGDRECIHRWADRDGRGGRANRGQLPRPTWPANSTPPQNAGDATATCARCGAWRGHLGLEPSPELYVQHLVDIFREVRRVLKPQSTLWLNLGDCYNAGTTAPRQPSPARVGYWQAAGSMGDRRVNAIGLKAKDLVGIPWRVALGLQADGWYLRADVIWAKPNPMPESVSDRPTRAHEYVFLLSRSPRYFYDAEAIREPAARSNGTAPAGWDTGPGSHGTIHRLGREQGERPAVSPTRKELPSALYSRHQAMIEGGQSLTARSGRNKRSVWMIATQPYREAHFATFPER